MLFDERMEAVLRRRDEIPPKDMPEERVQAVARILHEAGLGVDHPNRRETIRSILATLDNEERVLKIAKEAKEKALRPRRDHTSWLDDIDERRDRLSDLFGDTEGTKH